MDSLPTLQHSELKTNSGKGNVIKSDHKTQVSQLKNMESNRIWNPQMWNQMAEKMRMQITVSYILQHASNRSIGNPWISTLHGGDSNNYYISFGHKTFYVAHMKTA